MKAVLILGALCVAAVFAIPTEDVHHPTTATPELLTKQKNLLMLMWRVQEPNTNIEQVNIGKTYVLENDIESYKNKDAVKEFLIHYKRGFLPRNDIFSVFYEPHRVQMMKLFEVFFYAKDFETMYKVACWARDRVNEGMFVYALSVAVWHRPDCYNFALPPFYEMFPQNFVDSEVINKAHHEWFHHFDNHNHNVFIPVSNYTEFWTKHDVEQRVSYFGEDIGIAMFNKFMHLEFPFWMDSKKYGLTLDRKGELYYWMYQQLLARYEMERLANYLPETEAIDWEEPVVKHGYVPLVSYMNGVDFPLRPDNMHVQDLEDMTVHDVRDFERRIRDAIDKGYFYDRNGNKISMKDNKGIDYLGRMIKGFPDFPTTFFGKLSTYAFSLVSHVIDPLHTLGSAPGVLEHSETAPRDPAFFSLHKSINNLFNKYKDHLSPYKRDELVFPGVKIDSMDVDKLITYFDDFEIDLYSLFSGTYETDKNANIMARMPRLNHKNFNYKFEVTSDKEIDAVVRIFMGPKYNLYGHELTVEEKRHYMVEMDKFRTHLTFGKNTFTRNSKNAFHVMDDEMSTKTMIKKVEDALNSGTTIELKETFHCGFPEHMLLPRGRKGGMPFTMFVLVTPYDGDKTVPELGYCSSYDREYPETKPFGFPFDRHISEYDFNVPNMLWKDVIVFHKTREEINKSNV